FFGVESPQRRCEELRRRSNPVFCLASGFWIVRFARNDGCQICRWPQAVHRRDVTRTPSKNAIESEASGASRTRLLRTFNGIPGLRPVSIARLKDIAARFATSEASANIDFLFRTGSNPSYR